MAIQAQSCFSACNSASWRFFPLPYLFDAGAAHAQRAPGIARQLDPAAVGGTAHLAGVRAKACARRQFDGQAIDYSLGH